MELEISGIELSWDHDGISRSVRVNDLSQALVSEDQRVVAALVGENPGSQKLIIYSFDGSILRVIRQPNDHHFNFLGSNRGKDLAVMSKVKRSVWMDWWYFINSESGRLEELGEGR